jgi:hydrogenase maturation factor HypF (carbamoyltransferase family)
LRSAGFSVIRHHQVPTNDGGISLGQAHLGRLALESGRPIISAIHSEW